MDRGYLYIAYGERYLDEALRSAASLKKVDPLADITLVTTESITLPLFDRIVVRPFNGDSWKRGLLYKVVQMYDASPYERTFFVDTDTYFCASCVELFELLDYWDLCLTDCPNDCSIVSVANGPVHGYYPCSTGVIVFKKSAHNRELFRRWFEIYQSKMGSYQHDQGPLAEALLHSTSRPYVARSVYNAKLNFHTSFMSDQVKIIHGRADDYEQVRKQLNATPVNRSWDPVSRQCRPIPMIRYVQAYARYLKRMFARVHD